MSASASAIRAGRAFVELFADDSKLVRGLKAAQRKLRAWGASINRIGTQMMAAGAAIVAPLAYATRTFVGFEDAMKAVQAVTGTTGSQFDLLNEKAKELGRVTSFTAAEVAGAMLNLARAGFAAQEIDAAIAGMLNLSRATGTDLARATEMAAATLRGFNLAASESTRVADVLVATANNSAQTLDELGESMKLVAPIAHEWGLSIEETAKALGVLANMGIKGSMAGTSMRQAMLRLADRDVQQRIEALGVAVRDATGNMRTDFGGMLLEIGQAVQRMGSGERLALLKDLFDQRAVSAMAKLTTTDFPALGAAIDNAAGTAAKTAAVMDSGLGGAFRRLWSAVEGAEIAIGEALSQELSDLAEWLRASATEWAKWIKENKDAIVVASKVGAALLAVGVALKAVGAALALLAMGPFGVAVMVAAGTLAYYSHQAGEAARETRRLHEEALAYARAQREARGEDMEAIHRLAELQSKEALSNAEKAEAERLIHRLTDRYGALNVVLDATKGIVGDLADQTKRLVAAMEEQARVEQIKVLQTEYDKLLAEFRQMDASMGRIWGAMTTGVIEHNDALMALSRQIDEVGKKLKALQAGGPLAREDVFGEAGEPTGAAAGAVEVGGGLLPTKSDEALSFEQRMTEQLHQLRLQQIEDEELRAIASIEHRYAKQRQEAEALGADLAAIEAAREIEREAARKRFAEERRAEEERAAEERAAYEEDLADRIEQARIEATMDGEAKRQALLDLEEQRELRRARELGIDEEKIRELYDWRRKAGEVGDDTMRRVTAAGTFSAFGARGLAAGGPEERTARATEETARNTKRLLDTVRDGGLAFE